MPTLKEFVEALQAGWFPALVALVGCAIVVMADWYSLPYISDSPKWLVTTAVVVGVFSFSILIANVAYLPVLLWNAVARARNRKKFRKMVRLEVENAPPDERAILAYLITSGRRTFVARFDDRRLSPLLTKGILRKLGGENSVLEWSYVVQDDVWEYLLEHRDNYFFEDVSAIGDPFRYRSNTAFGASN
ncbi:MAG: super-infection exclusion protein B [Pseudomonadota bacterium]